MHGSNTKKHLAFSGVDAEFESGCSCVWLSGGKGSNSGVRHLIENLRDYEYGW